MHSPSFTSVQVVPIAEEKYTEKNKQKIDITFEDINYGVIQKGGQTKQILKNLSGCMKSGEVTAILGPSGGGKTSMLNILAGKIVNGKNISLTGKIMANGKTFSNEDFTKFSGYVMQNDILLDFFTVREAIQFAANMKVDGTKEVREQRVNEVIKSLKLERCQNTMIGGVHVKGISGGERKRVNMACELINDPQVLFLDEPTSGLDSFTSYIVIKLLKEYAVQKQKNVIMSIHSPNKDVWDLFDNVIFMSQGRYVYQGKAATVSTFFDKQGLRCPTYMCKPDYYMSKISATSIEKNPEVIQALFLQYDLEIEPVVHENIQQITDDNRNNENHYDFYQTGFWYQVKYIALRNIIRIKRDPLVLRSEISQMIFMGIFLGLVFLRLNSLGSGTTLRDINDRDGVLFLDIQSMFQAGVMAVLVSFPTERGVYMREENSKYYTPAAYAFGKIITDVPLKCLYPFIYGTIVFFMVGYTIDYAYQYFIYILILLLMSITGNALGFSIGIIFDDIRTSTSITPAFILPLVLFCGFFKKRSDLSSWISWIQYISPMTYSLEAILRNEYRDFNNPLLNPVDTLGLDIGLSSSIWAMIGLYVAFQAISVGVLYLKRGSIQ